jgi:single-strand DNA-binding protein
MKSMNKIQLIGYLGRDPEFRELKNGQTMAYMRLATNHWFQPKEGEPRKRTEWHGISVWGQEQIRKIRNYIVKGSHVLVEGRIVYRTYTNRQGEKKSVTEIKADYLVDLDR